MNFYIIIPAYNEEDSIGKTLESLVRQTLLPKRLVVVNDNSTDETQNIVAEFTKRYDWISLISNVSTKAHAPGKKIINAFYKGFEALDDNYDVICKFDADLIFPENYLETIASHFKSDTKLGMCAGHCHIFKNNKWQLETLTGKDHIRGALKTYRKKCFEDIGGLKSAMGWDTIDELLAQFYGWHFKTDDTLKVKHLKPTGKNYKRKVNYSQGQAFYQMRYGYVLTFIALTKLALRKKSFDFFIDSLKGYAKAKKNNLEYLVTKEQGAFIRRLRWKNIKKKFL